MAGMAVNGFKWLQIDGIAGNGWCRRKWLE